MARLGSFLLFCDTINLYKSEEGNYEARRSISKNKATYW